MPLTFTLTPTVTLTRHNFTTDHISPCVQESAASKSLKDSERDVHVKSELLALRTIRRHKTQTRVGLDLRPRGAHVQRSCALTVYSLMDG